jgi:hypothetical protein
MSQHAGHDRFPRYHLTIVVVNPVTFLRRHGKQVSLIREQEDKDQCFSAMYVLLPGVVVSTVLCTNSTLSTMDTGSQDI